MIIYDGVALESIAPVMVEDVRPGPIQMSATARQRPIRWGADFVRMTGGSRSVVVTFALFSQDVDARQKWLMEITKWARKDAPKRLMIPGHDGLYLDCLCTGLPEPSTRQWWEDRLRLTFATFDNPYWTGIDEKSAACGTAFTVLGSAPPLMRIEATRASADTGQTYSNGAQSMTFSAVPAGKMTIDLNRQTAAVDGASIMGAYDPASSFILPQTGAQTITGAGTVYWRERWE